MAVLEPAIVVAHLIFAGVWTGAIVFFAWRLHPLIAAGEMAVRPAERTVTGLRWLTRVGAIVFLATGGYLAGTRYETAMLIGSPDGLAVVSMVVLWLLLTGLVEATAARMLRELAEDRLRTAGTATATLARLAGLVAVVLLGIGGYLAA